MYNKIRIWVHIAARQRVWIKVLILTNSVSLIFLTLISFRYEVPQKIFLKLRNSIQNEKTAPVSYSGYMYPKGTIESLLYKRNGFNIVMLGDSITSYAHWGELLNRDDIANFGIAGDTTESIIRRINDVNLVSPARCFLMAGINDIFAGTSVDKIMINYKEIVNYLKQNNIEVTIQSTLYISKKASEFEFTGKNWEMINTNVYTLNELLKQFCIENDMIFLDINELLAKEGILEEQYTTDGLHLNKKGYEKWRDVLLVFCPKQIAK